MLTHGEYEIVRHFQIDRFFPRDQRLRLKTPGWRVLDFDPNPLSDAEPGLQLEKTLIPPLVKWDCQRVFSEKLSADQSGPVDTNLPMLTRVLPMMELLQLAGS